MSEWLEKNGEVLASNMKEMLTSLSDEVDELMADLMANGIDHHRDFRPKLEDLAGQRRQLLFLQRLAVEHFEEMRRVQRSVLRPAPTRPQSALGAGQFDRLVMLERAERL